MKAKNIPVTYVLFPDEGHGFARPENNIAFYAIAEKFLKACLGGRAEPIGQGDQGLDRAGGYGGEYRAGPVGRGEIGGWIFRRRCSWKQTLAGNIRRPVFCA